MIYLDHHATTPLDPAVLEAMMPFLTDRFGNASSRQHAYGWAAEEAVEAAREQVARLIGARDRLGAPCGKEIVFTSGATESINLALKGLVETERLHAPIPRLHLVSTRVEHAATRDVLDALTRQGCEVTWLEVDAFGRVAPSDVEAALRPDTLAVSILHASNEIGTIQPVAEIGAICRARGVVLHVDAAQSAGKIPLDVEAMHVDLLSLSAHKLYGPKGVGALYVRRRAPRVRLEPQLHGGGHERGVRSGTLNVPGIVGLGKACELAESLRAAEAERVSGLRDRLQERLFAAIEGIHLNGHPTDRLPGNLHVSLEGVESQALLMGLKEVAASSGSACASDRLEPSHVLAATGRDTALASLRLGLGRGTTEAEVDRAAQIIIQEVERQRSTPCRIPLASPRA
ncbi:MAG: cysteine desulfurase family protein [bacterium]|nr:cysteine desulfurase family protein [bacterium]